MARPLRCQFEGAIYYLMVQGTARQRLFRNDPDRLRYLDLLHRYRNRCGARIYAYVLMSRRVQLLLETPKGNISKFMQCLGTSYASYFNRRYKRKGSLYAGRYRSCPLADKEDALLSATRYLHRAAHGSRLNRHRNYAWSSYRVYLGRKESSLIDAEPVLSRFGVADGERQRRYREFVEDNGAGKSGRDRDLVRSRAYAWRYKGALKKNGNSESKEIALKKAQDILREVRLSLESHDGAAWGMKKKRALVHHVAMYLIRRQTPLPLRAIGSLLGVKAPAVALAIAKLEKSLTVGELPGAVCELLHAGSMPGSSGVGYLELDSA